MTAFVTALDAMWGAFFVAGLIYLAAAFVERLTRRTDPRDLVDRAHQWGDDE